MPGEIRELAWRALLTPEPAEKTAAVAAMVRETDATVDRERRLPPVAEPGRPATPVLVPPQQVPRRKLATVRGRQALVHALAHIEFNAINLALDAIARYAGLPAAYYRDWLQVAAEEAEHYRMLAAHLLALGCRYGDLPAHDGLWEAARKTRDDVLARMALVPRILEARGLDVTPGLQERLRAAGDGEAVAILDIILHDEIGHVAIGNHWYHHVCAARGLDPSATFFELCARYGASLPRPPFNEAARIAAGFAPEELARFQAGLGG